MNDNAIPFTVKMPRLIFLHLVLVVMHGLVKRSGLLFMASGAVRVFAYVRFYHWALP